ncbi:MAG: acetoacetate decarboxylase family protein [Candidatus Sericytochromatia bacterium]|nr:acetoacetate decarboxylase family protein [Candidatus Sericytochromatia bacterium]
MNIKEIKKNAFAMPYHNPAYPKRPYRFKNREYFIISYLTDPDKLSAVVPEPFHIDPLNPIVHYEFIRMPDSSGFGDYSIRHRQ